MKVTRARGRGRRRHLVRAVAALSSFIRSEYDPGDVIQDEGADMVCRALGLRPSRWQNAKELAK